jgi:hypothetical protein
MYMFITILCLTGVCCKLLDMVFQSVAKEVSKPLIASNSAIVMVAYKRYLVDYIPKSPLCGMKNHVHGVSLEVVKDKHSSLDFPNYNER